MFESTFQGPGAASLATYTLEILIIWLVSGLLGLLIGYFLWRLRPRTYFGLRKKIRELSARLRALEADNSQLQTDNEQLTDGIAGWKVKYEALLAKLKDKEKRLQNKRESLTALAAAADDLTAIKGVDVLIESLLHDAGVHTFQDLANAKPETLQVILKAAGSEYRSANPDLWRKQACRLFQSRKAHYADFAELKIGRKQLEALRLDLNDHSTNES